MPPLALRRLVGVAVVPGRHRTFQGAVGLLRHVFVLDLDEVQRELVHRDRAGAGRASGLVAAYHHVVHGDLQVFDLRSEEHTSELQSLMRISYAVFCLKKKKKSTVIYATTNTVH